MKFFKYWAGKSIHSNDMDFPITGYGYSNESIEDALRVAEERAAQTARALRTSLGAPDRDVYYGDRPIREEILDEFSDGDRQVAVVTRNSYGCLILNAAEVFFADIDLPSAKPSLLSKWFGKASEDPGEALVRKLRELTESDAGLGFRLYRTFNGFRCLVNSRTYSATDSESRLLLQRLGSDPMYVRLCKSQACFRARLSPKPWRIGLAQPTGRYPFADPAREQAYRTWVGDYTDRSQSYATCALIGSFGDSQTPDSIDRLIQLHDHYALNGDAPLA